MTFEEIKAQIRYLDIRQTLTVYWWTLGITPKARRRAFKLVTCLLEGRTGRAAYTLASTWK